MSQVNWSSTTLVIIPIFAMLVAFISNMTGIGGGGLLVLFFLYYIGTSSVSASGLSLITTATSSVAGSFSNIRHGHVNTKLFRVLLIFALIGIVLGSLLSFIVPTNIFKGVFGLIPIAIGTTSLVLTLKEKEISDHVEPKKYFDRGTSLSALAAGIVSGFTGIGIGGITGTYLTSVKKMRPKTVFSTLILTMILTSVLGGLIHLSSFKFSRNTELYIPLLIIGAAIGALAGARVSGVVRSRSLRLFQAITIISIGLLAISIYLITR